MEPKLWKVLLGLLIYVMGVCGALWVAGLLSTNKALVITIWVAFCCVGTALLGRYLRKKYPEEQIKQASEITIYQASQKFFSAAMSLVPGEEREVNLGGATALGGITPQDCEQIVAEINAAARGTGKSFVYVPARVGEPPILKCSLS